MNGTSCALSDLSAKSTFRQHLGRNRRWPETSAEEILTSTFFYLDWPNDLCVSISLLSCRKFCVVAIGFVSV